LPEDTYVTINDINIVREMNNAQMNRKAALLKELNKSHEQQALLPKRKEDVSYEERKKALRYLMFINEKRDGTIKVRGCANRRSQCEYTNKADMSSPMESLEAMLLTCARDAKEGGYVTVTDIPGAFLHADMERYVHMLL